MTKRTPPNKNDDSKLFQMLTENCGGMFVMLPFNSETVLKGTGAKMLRVERIGLTWLDEMEKLAEQLGTVATRSRGDRTKRLGGRFSELQAVEVFRTGKRRLKSQNIPAGKAHEMALLTVSKMFSISEETLANWLKGRQSSERSVPIEHRTFRKRKPKKQAKPKID